MWPKENTPPKPTWTRLLRTPTSACMDISVGQKTVGAKRSMTLMIMETDYRPKWQTSGSRSWRTLYKPQYQQRRLMLSPTEHNDGLKLEPPRAWELQGSWGSHRIGEAESSHNFVSHGNKVVYSWDGTYKDWVGLPLYASCIKWTKKGRFGFVMGCRGGCRHTNLFSEPHRCQHTYTKLTFMEVN